MDSIAVVRGAPTDEELAALTAVLLALTGSGDGPRAAVRCGCADGPRGAPRT